MKKKTLLIIMCISLFGILIILTSEIVKTIKNNESVDIDIKEVNPKK